MANVATGFSVALTTVLVPPVLARTLSPLEFGAWALVLQIAGYVSILDLGIQGAIGRYVAYFLANLEPKRAEDFVSTSFNVLCITALLGFAGLAVTSSYLHTLFPQIPESLLAPTQLALVLVGLGISLGLPASSFRGILSGIERYELVTFIAAPTGLLLSGTLIALALGQYGLIVLAIAFAAIKILSYGLYWVVARVYGPVKVKLGFVNRKSAIELWSYCSSSMIWSVGILMVSGLDVAIVARLDFSRVAAYSACAALVTLIAGAQNAMFRPLLQVGSRYFVKGETNALHALMEKSTRIAIITIAISAAVGLLLSHRILALWLGNSYAAQATLILRLLIIGQAMRLIATPYATLLLATNNHRITRIPVIFEALSNTTAAVVLGIKFGANGVACGVIVGAVVSLLMIVFYTYPRTREVLGDGRSLLYRAILVPLACFAPLGLVPVVCVIRLSNLSRVVIITAVVASCLTATWKMALDSGERHWVRKVASPIWLWPRKLLKS